MTGIRGVRRLAGPTGAVVLAWALLAMLVSAASVPHVHAGPASGLFNHDHDLTSLALGGAALLPDVTVSAVLGPVVSPPLALAARRPATAPERSADPRAPPLR